MDNVMAMAGWVAIAALFLAIVVLSMISWIKGRRSEKRDHDNDNDGSGSGIMTEGSTPGYWE
jgi:hypothetical protein